MSSQKWRARISGPQAGVPGAGGEQGHLRLAGGERAVQRGQVGDLERDDPEAEAGGNDLERARAGTRAPSRCRA